MYVAEDAATGLYLNLAGEKPQPVEFDEATKYPGTPDGRTEALKQLARLALIERALFAELVRVDAP